MWLMDNRKIRMGAIVPYFTLLKHSWLRHYATSWKVAGSSPAEVIDFFFFFTIYIFLPTALLSGIYLVCNRNEYQEYSWGVKRCLHVSLTTSPSSVSWLSIKWGSLDISRNRVGIHCLLHGTALLTFTAEFVWRMNKGKLWMGCIVWCLKVLLQNVCVRHTVKSIITIFRLFLPKLSPNECLNSGLLRDVFLFQVHEPCNLIVMRCAPTQFLVALFSSRGAICVWCNVCIALRWGRFEGESTLSVVSRGACLGMGSWFIYIAISPTQVSSAGRVWMWFF
jgi:hypothetical protein